MYIYIYVSPSLYICIHVYVGFRVVFDVPRTCLSESAAFGAPTKTTLATEVARSALAVRPANWVASKELK